jgi:hypothetical protein
MFFFRNINFPPPSGPPLHLYYFREKLKARLPVLISVLPVLAGRGGIICTFVEVAKGMAYRLAARTVQQWAIVDLKTAGIKDTGLYPGIKRPNNNFSFPGIGRP